MTATLKEIEELKASVSKLKLPKDIHPEFKFQLPMAEKIKKFFAKKKALN